MSAVASQAPRPVKAILAEALAELRAREQRLAGALAEVRSALRAFEAAHGAVERERVSVPPQDTGVPAQLHRVPSAAPISDTERDQAVRDAIGRLQPVAMAALIERTDLTVAFVRDSIKRLRDSGDVQMTGSKSTARYWLTADLDAHIAKTGLANP